MSTHPLVRCCYAGMVLVAALASAATVGNPAPTTGPTPTPRPGTLAAYAGRVTLRRPPTADPDAPLEITTDDLSELGVGGALTLGGSTGPPIATPATPLPTPDPGVRERWCHRYAAKRAALHRLETRRKALLDDLDLLQGGRLTARTLARIDQAKAKLDRLDEELRRAEHALAAVVRAARKEGAQPGWFRGL